MRNRLSRPSGDDGAVAVLFALLSVVLVGMLAFAADLGNAYAVKRKLSTAADGAALAGAQEISLSGKSCTDPAVAAAAREEVRKYDRANADDGSGSYQTLLDSDIVLSCDATGGTVRVTNRQEVTFVFAGVLGVDSVVTPGAATARYGRPASLQGLRPFGLCDKSPEFLALRSSSGDFATRPTVRIPFEKTKDGNCGPAPGNWGAIDFDGGSNSTGELRDWITNGYAGEVSLGGDSVLSGQPGNLGGGAFETQLNSIVGKTILLPVYTAAAKSGNTATFTITEFLSVRFCGWRTSNVKSNLDEPDRLDPDGCSNTIKDTTFNYLEMRFDRAISVGDFCLVAALCTSTGIDVLALIE